MQLTYYVQAYTALSAVKRLLAQRTRNASIVFVSSFLGYTSFVGYSTYSPGKYALRGKSRNLSLSGYWYISAIPPLTSCPFPAAQRQYRLALNGSSPIPPSRLTQAGLADSLRSEMLAHSPAPSIHIFMPAGIDSPGYVQEQLEKPSATKKLEEGDRVDQPGKVAMDLIKGASCLQSRGPILSHLRPVNHRTPDCADTSKGWSVENTNPARTSSLTSCVCSLAALCPGVDFWTHYCGCSAE